MRIAIQIDCRMKKRLRRVVDGIPVARSISRMLRMASFPGTQKYWEARYASGKTSGIGSYGRLAEFKAEVINSFVRENNVQSVIEFGCGDGNQLSLTAYPTYVGLDVSESAIKLCNERFKDEETKRFSLYEPDRFLDRDPELQADLALSLDVLFHLVEEKIFELHMRHLFSAAERFVIIYSSDTDVNDPSQVRYVYHRKFSKWVKVHLPEWSLLRRIPNKYPLRNDPRTESFCDFFIYERAARSVKP